MSTTTENYGLHQWEPEDDFLRTDFNEDNAKIDAALSAIMTEKAKVIVGNYTGNDAAERTISLGATPKAVFVCSRASYIRNYSNIYGGLAVTGSPVSYMNGGTLYSPAAVEIVAGGFLVRQQSIASGNASLYTNSGNEQYNYIAIV